MTELKKLMKYVTDEISLSNEDILLFFKNLDKNEKSKIIVNLLNKTKSILMANQLALFIEENREEQYKEPLFFQKHISKFNFKTFNTLDLIAAIVEWSFARKMLDVRTLYK